MKRGTRLHTCEQCGKRSTWGKEWHYLPGVASDHDVTPDGLIFPVRFCSKACDDLWFKKQEPRAGHWWDQGRVGKRAGR